MPIAFPGEHEWDILVVHTSQVGPRSVESAMAVSEDDKDGEPDDGDEEGGEEGG